jgi:hypothetical protein
MVESKIREKKEEVGGWWSNEESRAHRNDVL